MDSFAITLFFVCACGGMLSVALLHRWLHAQSGVQPDIRLDSEPASEPIVAPLPPSRAVGVHGPEPVSPPVFDDEPTQPMTRTDTAFGSTDFPSTLPLEAQEADPAGAANHGFADTLPMPVEPAG